MKMMPGTLRVIADAVEKLQRAAVRAPMILVGDMEVHLEYEEGKDQRDGTTIWITDIRPRGSKPPVAGVLPHHPPGARGAGGL